MGEWIEPRTTSVIRLSWLRRKLLTWVIPKGGVIIPADSLTTLTQDRMRISDASKLTWETIFRLYATDEAVVNDAIHRVIRWTQRKLEDLRDGKEEPW